MRADRHAVQALFGIILACTSTFICFAEAATVSVSLQESNISESDPAGPLSRSGGGSYSDGVTTYSEYARADFGSLSTRATVLGHIALPGARATAGFTDSFTVIGPEDYNGDVVVQWGYSLEGFLSASNSSPTGPRGESWAGVAGVDSRFTLNSLSQTLWSSSTHSLYTELGGLTGDPVDANITATVTAFLGQVLFINLSLTSTAQIDNIACRHAAGGCGVPGNGSADSSYDHTLLMFAPRFFDLAGNELMGFGLLSESGTDYANLRSGGPGGGTVPEPGTVLLLGLGLAALVALRRRKLPH